MPPLGQPVQGLAVAGPGGGCQVGVEGFFLFGSQRNYAFVLRSCRYSVPIGGNGSIEGCYLCPKTTPETRSKTGMKREELVDEMFKQVDTNNDGVLSRGEFVELVRCLTGEHGVGVSSKIFDEFDANQDGVISRDEALEMIIEFAL
ncbi:MAG: EF-hand domain-containing protein [Wenzhouxiangella sp.]|nr:EF-hand domain-containing protein [Wenzhouxiangella sp.]